MKHIKLFEQFILESAPYTPKGAQDQMLDILLSMNKKSAKNGKFKLLFKSSILADSYSRLTGLPLYNNDSFLIATSNNKKELQDMKKEFWDSIFPEHKKALKFNGTSLVIEGYMNENLDFTYGDLDVEEDEIDNDFALLKKYTAYVGAKKPSDLYLAGGTEEGNEDEFKATGSPEKLELMIHSGPNNFGTVRMGTMQGEKAFEINDGYDTFIWVGPKSKNKF
jgi:hypothetical protein